MDDEEENAQTSGRGDGSGEDEEKEGAETTTLLSGGKDESVPPEKAEEEAEEKEENNTSPPPSPKRRRASACSRWSGKEEPLLKKRVVEKDFRTVTFSTDAVNAHLVCRLCDGYFQDAHTITECLHTFCRSCLVRYLEDGNTTCPACQVHLGPHPMNTILHDRTLQTLVDKIFPVDDGRGDDDDDDQAPPSKTNGEAAAALKTAPPADARKKSESDAADPPQQQQQQQQQPQQGGDQVSFKVEPDPEAEESSSSRLPLLEKPYLKTSGKLKVSQLSRYLAKKLKLPPNSLELVCAAEVLAPDHSLHFVRRSLWCDDDVELVVHYRHRKDAD